MAVLGLGMLLTGCAGGTDSHGADEHGATSDHEPAIECGSSTYEDGHQVIRYCGDGSAEVRVDGAASATVRGGVCDAHGAFVTANFGTNYSNPEAADGDYVGLLLTDLPETGREARARVTAVELTIDGERVAVSADRTTATLARGALAARVTGSGPKGPVTIAASCTVQPG